MDPITKRKIAEFICGDDKSKHPVYRSSFYLTKFFQDIGINISHDGTSRNPWATAVINNLNGIDLQKVILRLGSPRLYGGDREQIKLALSTMNEILAIESLKIVIDGVDSKLIKIKPNFDFTEEPEEEVELKPLPPPEFEKLNLEAGISDILQKRWVEIQKCIEAEANLSAMIMMGSMLEGFLLGVVQKYPQLANTTEFVPKKDGKPKYFADWTLSELIDVSYELGCIKLDRKKFGHALRDFRNLIHPYEQLSKRAFPDIDTCKISWLVVQASCNDIAAWLKIKEQ